MVARHGAREGRTLLSVVTNGSRTLRSSDSPGTPRSYRRKYPGDLRVQRNTNRLDRLLRLPLSLSHGPVQMICVDLSFGRVSFFFYIYISFYRVSTLHVQNVGLTILRGGYCQVWLS